jgi:hypothetical protein
MIVRWKQIKEQISRSARDACSKTDLDELAGWMKGGTGRLSQIAADEQTSTDINAA